MKQKLQSILFALIAIMMPIGASALSKPYTIGASGASTLYLPFDVAFSNDLRAFYVTGITVNDDGTVKLVEKEITGVIPANTAVILRGEPGNHDLEVIDAVDPVVSEEDNLLKGTLIDKPLDCSENTPYFALCAGSTGDNVWADWQAPTNEDGTSYTLGANNAYLDLSGKLEPSKIAELKALPHLQHTYGGCEICGQVTTLEAKWGTSADAVTFTYGTLAQAFAAAEAENSTVGYIQLLSDVASESGYSITGGEFTLDLNGCTLTSESNALMIKNQRTSVTLTGGDVVTSGVGAIAIDLEDGANLQVLDGDYTSLAYTVCIREGCSATVKGGTFSGSGSLNVVTNSGNLLIEGGDFGGESIRASVYTVGASAVTTITGGTFASGIAGNFEYRGGGKLDLSRYADIDNTTLYNMSDEDVVPGAKTIVLPEGYCFYEEDGSSSVPALNSNSRYVINPAQVKWGTSADAETFTYGALAQAFAAAEAENSTVGYIQLLSDVTSESSYFVYGGTFTLDLNGKTLQSTTTTLNINGGNVTFTDGSEKQTGKVATTSEGTIAVCVESGNPTITIMGGQYEAVNREALEIYSGSVTIRGGEFTTAGLDQIVAVVDSDEANPSLTIMGGTFVAQNVNQIMYMDGNTTISGGTFVGGNYSTVCYIGGTLSFDETPGFSPMGLRVEYNAEASINLPDGYGIYNVYEEPQSELVTNMVYYIGKTGGVSYTVTFSANYDTEATMDDAIVTSPIGKYALPACTFNAPEGKMFKAWLVGGVEYQPGEEIYVTSDTEVKAVWAVPYIVSFDANGGEGDMDAIVTLSDATLPECTFTAPVGQMFKAWQVDGAKYQPYEMITVSADTEVKAEWTDYVPQIVIKMEDTVGDSWNGNAIVVKQNGEVVGTATIIEEVAAATAKFDYDASCEYSFYWDLPELEEGGDSWPHECSFEIYVEGELVFAATTDNCAGFEDNQLLHTISVSTISEVSIADGTLTEYSNSQNLCVGTLTYTRSLPNLTWNALYVPFEIPVTEEFLSKYDVAYINDVHSYDTDDNGTIDNMEMELIKIKSGTLRANYPYLIRAKSDEDKELTLELTDATLFSTSDRNSVYCSSAFTEFHIFGTYEQMAKPDIMEICDSYVGETRAGLVVAGDGSWKSMANDAVLNPFRLYMVMVTSGDSPVKVDPAAFSRVRIRIQGEGGETGIEEVEATVDGQQPTVIYDLMGRRVAVPQKGTIYVVNGKKVMWK